MSHENHSSIPEKTIGRRNLLRIATLSTTTPDIHVGKMRLAVRGAVEVFNLASHVGRAIHTALDNTDNRVTRLIKGKSYISPVRPETLAFLSQRLGIPPAKSSKELLDSLPETSADPRRHLSEQEVDDVLKSMR